MFRLKVIRHSDVTPSELDEIIKIKSVAWPYSFEAQLKWIKGNISEKDLHVVLITDEGEWVAYLNLIDLDLIVDGFNVKGLGVGNVCSKFTGKGFGKQIMKLVNDFIKTNHKIGLLFCKNSLIDFYKSFSWELLNLKRANIPEIVMCQGVVVMIYTCGKPISSLQYFGKLI